MFSFHFFIFIFNNKYQVKTGFHYKFVLLKKWKKQTYSGTLLVYWNYYVFKKL